MNKNPLVSIVVPVYNTEAYLEDCIKSIISQTYDNLEIIIVNDGSTDNSAEICKRIIGNDIRIHYIEKANSGVSDTRNIGIDNASGEYMIFADSDDLLAPDMIRLLVTYAEKNNSDFVICGNYNLSTFKTSERHLFSNERSFEGDEYLYNILFPTLGPIIKNINPSKLDKLTPIWARLYKTSVIKTNGIKFIDLNKLPSECLQFNLEYCLHITKASYVDRPLYYYRRNTISSVTKPFRTGLIDKWLWWIDYVVPIITSNPNRAMLNEALNGRIICSLIPLGGNALKIKDKKERLKEFNRILNIKQVQTALREYDTKKSPFCWRLFFFAARIKNVPMFMFLTWSMRKILKLRKS